MTATSATCQTDARRPERLQTRLAREWGYAEYLAGKLDARMGCGHSQQRYLKESNLFF